MLEANRTRILDMLRPEATVLDVGGWAKPFSRANWVIDLMPHDSRGLYGEVDPASERFTEESWLTFDVCDRTPWPFDDKSFDFATCSHTLEDLRDPIWVCSELQRVSRAGYIEVPSRLEEQSLGVNGADWAGWSHHRWLIDRAQGALRFVFKPHVLSADPSFHFPGWFGAALTPEQRVETHFWEDELHAREVVFAEAEKLRSYLRDYVSENIRLQDKPSAEGGAVGRLRRRRAESSRR